MTISPQRWLGSLAVAGLMALPIVSRAEDDQKDRERDAQEDSQKSDSDRDRNEDRDRDQDRDRDRNRDESRSRQNDDRDWADNSPNEEDQGGLGVTLYERESGREGATIRRVHPNSPAEQMGLRAGDRITKINGDEVDSYRDLIKEVRDLESGDQVRIEIQRDGDSKTVRGELESRREALVFRGQGQGDRGQMFNRRGRDGRWNQERERVAFQGDRSGYNQRSYGDQSNRRQFSYEGGSSDGTQQHVHQQLDSLERQVNQLRREIDRLRSSVDGRDSARSQGYTSSDGQSRGDSSRDDRSRGYERESQAGYSDSGSQNEYGSRTSYDAIDSPGGQVGEERLRPNSNVDN